MVGFLNYYLNVVKRTIKSKNNKNIIPIYAYINPFFFILIDLFIDGSIFSPIAT